jgi:hypothetical protein
MGHFPLKCEQSFRTSFFFWMRIENGKRRKKPGPGMVLGAAVSGFVELTTFHPVDTIAKRLIHHRGSAFGASSSRLESLGKVIFKDAAEKTALGRYFSLFRGFKYAVAYKVSQRTYQFGGHPFVNEFVKTHYGSTLVDLVGSRNAQFTGHAISGAIIGLGEVMLLPFDMLKVRGQTANINSQFPPKNQSLFAHFGNDTLGALKALYRGAGWTAARNSIGCFSLFGTSALVKDKVLDLQDYSMATVSQEFSCALIASAMSILVVAPLDVIKVRIQAAPLSTSTQGWTLLKSLLRQEGPTALFKGTIPKLLVAGPKVAFGFTVAQQLSKLFTNYLENNMA